MSRVRKRHRVRDTRVVKVSHTQTHSHVVGIRIVVVISSAPSSSLWVGGRIVEGVALGGFFD